MNVGKGASATANGPNLVKSLARFGFGLALALCSSLLTRVLPAGGTLAVVDWSVAIHLLNALVGGPLAWLGGVAGELATISRFGVPRPRGLALVAGMALPGLAALLLRRRVRHRPVGSSLRALDSYGVLFSFALVGGLVGGTLASYLTFRGFHPFAALIWIAGSMAGTLLAVPLLLTAVEVWLPGLLVEPGATGASPWRLAGGRRRFVAALVGTLLLGLVVALLGRQLPAAEGWLHLLLVLPVLWAAEYGGQRAGVVAASIAGLSFLAVRTLVPHPGTAFAGHLEALGVLPPLILFSLIGAVRGAAWERERALTASLETANRKLREDLEQTVRAFSTAIEAKDHYTDEHVNRVGEYALAVGRRLGLAGEDLVALHWAAMLHDLGKIGVPEQVLNKPGPLSEAERQRVLEHPEIGARILSHIPGMRAAAPLVLHHQERWDGRRDGLYPGYPTGIAGEQIPLGARVIAVVDTFDALTSDRPYRRARPFDEAVAELEREGGRQFDPRVVEVFVELLAERPWAVAGETMPNSARALCGG